MITKLQVDWQVSINYISKDNSLTFKLCNRAIKHFWDKLPFRMPFQFSVFWLGVNFPIIQTFEIIWKPYRFDKDMNSSAYLSIYLSIYQFIYSILFCFVSFYLLHFYWKSDAWILFSKRRSLQNLRSVTHYSKRNEIVYLTFGNGAFSILMFYLTESIKESDPLLEHIGSTGNPLAITFQTERISTGQNVRTQLKLYCLDLLSKYDFGMKKFIDTFSRFINYQIPDSNFRGVRVNVTLSTKQFKKTNVFGFWWITNEWIQF